MDKQSYLSQALNIKFDVPVYLDTPVSLLLSRSIKNGGTVLSGEHPGYFKFTVIGENQVIISESVEPIGANLTDLPIDKTIPAGTVKLKMQVYYDLTENVTPQWTAHTLTVGIDPSNMAIPNWGSQTFNFESVLQEPPNAFKPIITQVSGIASPQGNKRATVRITPSDARIGGRLNINLAVVGRSPTWDVDNVLIGLGQSGADSSALVHHNDNNPLVNNGVVTLGAYVVNNGVVSNVRMIVNDFAGKSHAAFTIEDYTPGVTEFYLTFDFSEGWISVNRGFESLGLIAFYDQAKQNHLILKHYSEFVLDWNQVT